MPTTNTVLTAYEHNTISADTTGTTLDTLSFTYLDVYWNVTQGSATDSHTIALKIQTCDTDSSDDNDWITLTPQIGTLSTVTGTGGTNAWPTAQVVQFQGFARYVRAYLDITNGTWTTKVTIVGRGVD